MIEGLEKMLAKGMDNALLRFGLGKGYLDAEKPNAPQNICSAAWSRTRSTLPAGNCWARHARLPAIWRAPGRPGSRAWKLPRRMATSRPKRK